MNPPGNYRLLEHTADMGVEATGETLGELFIEAARGLREIISSGNSAAISSKDVEVSGGDVGEVLVNWLNEIVFLLESEGFLPADFEAQESSTTRFSGKILGEVYDPQRHFLEREIKAVTYHQLQVEELPGGWRARFYVDL